MRAQSRSTHDGDRLAQKNAPVAIRKQRRNLIHRQRSLGLSIQRGCQMIQLPRSTFYYQIQQPAPHLSDEQIVERIEAIQDELSGYGYRRVTRALQAQGYGIHRKRVARIMRQHGLGIKPKVRTTDSQRDWPICPNLYRNKIPDQPDPIWVADITYIRIEAGFVYLAVILDACSRKGVGYAIGRHPAYLGCLKSRCSPTPA
jgi:putative transposase